MKTHVENLGYLLTLQIGGLKPPFRRLRNLTANLTAYISGTKYDKRNRESALTTTRGILRRPKISWTLVNKRLQTGPQKVTGTRVILLILVDNISVRETVIFDRAYINNGTSWRLHVTFGILSPQNITHSLTPPHSNICDLKLTNDRSMS